MFRSGLLILTTVLLISGDIMAQTARIGVVSLPPNKGNPFRSSAVFSTLSLGALFEPLVQFDNARVLSPFLAESWAQDGPTTWTVQLKSGLVFSNGEPLDAEAVAATLNYLTSDDAQGASVARDVRSIEKATAIGELSLTITTKWPDAALPRYLATVSIVEPDLWASLGPDGFASDPVGSGPFLVDEWTSAEIRLSRNDLSWRAPKLEGLEIIELREGTSRLQGLLTGRIDVAVQINPEDEALIERAGGQMILREPIDVITLTYAIGEGHPVDDLRVRRALNLALNREAIVEVLLGGHTSAASQPAVTGVLGYNPDIPAFSYDPNQARALLAEAGYPDGFELTAEVIIGSNVNDAAVYQQMAADLAAVGVTLKISSIPTTQMVRVILEGEWRGNAFSQIFGAWPAFDALRSIRMHSCDWPKPWFCDPALTPLYESARTAPTLTERTALTSELVRSYRELETALYLYEIPLFDGISERVTNYEIWPGRIDYASLMVRTD